MAELTVSDAHNGAKLTVRVGDAIIVRLSESAAAGYRWTLTAIDPARLEMMEHSYEPTRAGVGSAGASVWKFTPTHAGRTRLELKKLRPWNPADPASEHFAVDLVIGE